MPITGNEALLTSQLTSAITAAIEAKYGHPIRDPEYIDALSAGIANAIIPFLVTNTQVNTGQLVNVPGTNPINPTTGLFDGFSNHVTGTTTGTVDTTGTIS